MTWLDTVLTVLIAIAAGGGIAWLVLVIDWSIEQVPGDDA